MAKNIRMLLAVFSYTLPYVQAIDEQNSTLTLFESILGKLQKFMTRS
jgi:hypothetical protein